MNKCCEKCWHECDMRNCRPGCEDGNCPCHSQESKCCERPVFCRCMEHGGKCHNCGKARPSKPEETTTSDWERLFSREFIREDDGLLAIGKYDEQDVKDFIRETVAKDRKKFSDELRETIIGLRAGKKNAKEGLNVLRDFGYDEALSAVLALLPEQESK